MSQISIDWRSTGVVVACPVGPEQPPAIILPTPDARLSGSLAFNADGEARLEWSTQEPSKEDEGGRNISAQVRAVCEIAHAGLDEERVRISPSGPAKFQRLKNSSKNAIVIGDQEWAANRILRRYVELLRHEIEVVIRRTPRLLAVVDAPPEDVICAVNPHTPPAAAATLRQALLGAGYRSVSLVRRWATAAAWRLRAEQLGEPCMILDWGHKSLQVGVCAGSDADFESAAPTALATLAAAGEEAVKRRVVEHLRSSGDFGLAAETDPTSPAGRPQVTDQAIEAAADDLVRQLFLDTVLPRTSIRGVDNRPFEERYGRKAGTWEPPLIPIELPPSVAAEILADPIKRVCNGLSTLQRRNGRTLPNVVGVTGCGFALPGAADAIENALDGQIHSGDAAFASAKGALLLRTTSRDRWLPYDCGIMFSMGKAAGRIGTGVLRRGQALPCSTTSKIVTFNWNDGKPLGVSIYLRKVDFGEGKVTYASHGYYNFAPEVNTAGKVQLQAEIRADKECQIDVTVTDLVANQTMRLEQMGILGGQSMSAPPMRDSDEIDGGLFRRMFESLRSTLANEYDLTSDDALEEMVGALSRKDFRSFLDEELGDGTSQQETPRKVAAEALALQPPNVLDEGHLGDTKKALELITHAESSSDAELKDSCGAYLSMLLIGFARGLAELGKNKNLARAAKSAAQGKVPLPLNRFARLANAISPALNRLEARPNSEDDRSALSAAKKFHGRLMELNERLGRS